MSEVKSSNTTTNAQNIDQYAVVGNPIAHSKSPIIHASFAEKTQQKLHYGKQLVAVDDFKKDVNAFFASGGKGLNITVPFKEEAFHFATTLTQRAQLAGAVNTLALQADGSILGDTTDGIGLVNDLKRQGFLLNQARVLVLGAGGAVRGVLEPLLAEQPHEVIIANRTLSKAQQLATIFSPHGNIRACEFKALNNEEFLTGFDTVINGTSASLKGELPPVSASIFAAKSTTGAYDMMYGKELTPFLAWAKNNGANKVADGLGMLVGQAAASFKLWRGVMPNVEEVIEALRSEA